MVTHPRANHGPKLRDHTRTGVYCRSVHQLVTYINMRPNWSTSVGFGSVDFRKQNKVRSKGIIKRKKKFCQNVRCWTKPEKQTNNCSIKMFFTGQKSIINLLGKNHHNDYEKVLILRSKTLPT